MKRVLGQGSAFDDSPTADAFRGYRSRAWTFTVAGLASIVIATVAVGLSDGINRLQGAIGLYGFGFGPVLLWVGVVALIRSARMSRLLRSLPWERRVIRYAANAWGKFLLVDGLDLDNGVYLLSGTRQRIDRFTRGKHTDVLFAGLPNPWVIAAPSDRSLLVIARRPRRSWVRQRARATATRPPLTRDAQARVHKEVRVYLVALAPTICGIMLVAVFVNMWLGAGLMLCGLVGMRLVVRRWTKLPREQSPATSQE